MAPTWSVRPVRGPRPRLLLIVIALVVALTVTAVPRTGSAAPAPTLDQVKAQLAALATQAEVAQERLNQVRVDIAAAQRVLAELQSKVARSQAQVSAAQGGVDQIASQEYRSGGIDETVQVLLADNPNEFLDQLAAMDLVSQRRADVLRGASVATQRLAQDRLAAAQQLDQLHALFAQATDDYQQVVAAQSKATALFDSLQAAQRAAILREQAQARAAAVAAARAALAQARADAARAAAAAAARAASTRKQTETHTTPSHKTTRPPASTGGSGSGSGGSGSGPSSSIGQRVVAYALARVGDAYVWGAAGPNAYDCSGLTMRAYQSVGVSLPHSSSAQYGYGRHISASALLPGDLVFYYSPIHHVGIYIGHGMIVNAENPSVGVVVAPLYSMPYVGAVRPY